MNKEKRMDTMEMYPYETCDICGNRIVAIYSIRNSDWLKIMGHAGGTLCLGCMDRKAQQKNIKYNLDSPVDVLRWDGHGLNKCKCAVNI